MVSRDIERRNGLKQNLIGILQDIYPEIHSSVLDNFAEDLASLVQKNKSSDRFSDSGLWSEDDVLLIAYPDNINSQTTAPLQSLQKFLTEYFYDTINIVHILPFFPSTGDDGFSVQNYFEVDEKLGDWSDIGEFVKNSTLMVDVVLNHCSVATTHRQMIFNKNGTYFFTPSSSPPTVLTPLFNPKFGFFNLVLETLDFDFDLLI